MKTLPFLPEFEGAIRSGRKRVTSRTRRYGHEGDVLSTPFGLVELRLVTRHTLGDVAKLFWQEEGADSPEHFALLWARIHPRMGFVAHRRVWVHLFRLLEGQ